MGKAGSDIDWVKHADDVLKELVSIGDELCRFLTLPTASDSRHRMTRSGRREAARTAEVAYRLYDSLYSRRFVKLSKLSDKIKLAGLGGSEGSRIRQFERYMGEAIENLRMIKMYRPPQTLRSFARLFTTLLPPFFAPTFAELAINVDSLTVAIMFAVIVSLCLNALLKGVEILEDPFVAFVTLDGIDIREEFQVLHYHQLVNARNEIFKTKLNPISPGDANKAGSDIDWVKHADDVLKELVSIGDELCRFLTLPTASDSRHRMTRSGRREAARTAEVAYRLYDSLYSRRFVKLSKLSDKIKLAGLRGSEGSRIRQFERYMGEAIENLRMIKMYRTPQTLRSFARLFTTLLPPFFAPTFAELAINVDSLTVAIMFAVIVSLCL